MEPPVTEEIHYDTGPSSADTWAWCPGSINAQQGVPNPDSVHSREGTLAHEFLERAAKGEIEIDFDAGTFTELGKPDKLQKVPLTVDSLAGVKIALEFVKEQLTEGCVFKSEHKTDPGPICGNHTEMAGTCDLSFYYPHASYLHIADYKNGRSPVNVENSLQLLLYGLGEYDHYVRNGYPVTTIRLTIIQPNRKDGRPPISTVELSEKQLLDWVPFFTNARQRVENPNAERIPGETQCKWCRAKATCKSFAEHCIAGATATIQPIDSRDMHVPLSPEYLTKEQLASCASKFDMIRKWMDAVEAYMVEQSQAGEDFIDLEGRHWGAVPKQGRRRWKYGADETMKKLSNKLKAVNKGLEKDDRLGLSIYRGYKLLGFGEVFKNIKTSSVPEDIKSELKDAIEKALIETPETTYKLGEVQPQLIVEEKTPEEKSPEQPAPVTAESFLC